jgi:hypothetical protein
VREVLESAAGQLQIGGVEPWVGGISTPFYRTGDHDEIAAKLPNVYTSLSERLSGNLPRRIDEKELGFQLRSRT